MEKVLPLTLPLAPCEGNRGQFGVLAIDLASFKITFEVKIIRIQGNHWFTPKESHRLVSVRARTALRRTLRHRGFDGSYLAPGLGLLAAATAGRVTGSAVAAAAVSVTSIQVSPLLFELAIPCARTKVD